MRVVQNNDTVQATCLKCRSILAISATDIKYNEIPHHCSTFEVTCGACGRITGIQTSVVPQRWYPIIGVID